MTTVGRISFREGLPVELGFHHEVMDRKALKSVVAASYERLGNQRTADAVDAIKRVGFHYNTTSGLTIAVSDLRAPDGKAEIIAEAEGKVSEIEDQFETGLIP